MRGTLVRFESLGTILERVADFAEFLPHEGGVAGADPDHQLLAGGQGLKLRVPATIVDGLQTFVGGQCCSFPIRPKPM